jgi:hypothetical protein
LLQTTAPLFYLSAEQAFRIVPKKTHRWEGLQGHPPFIRDPPAAKDRPNEHYGNKTGGRKMGMQKYLRFRSW